MRKKFNELISKFKSYNNINLNDVNDITIDNVNGRSQIIINGVPYNQNSGDNRDIVIIVNGDVKGKVINTNGNIHVFGNVNESVSSTNGDITIGEYVNGSVSSTNGDIDIKGSVQGNVKSTNGDISRK